MLGGVLARGAELIPAHARAEPLDEVPELAEGPASRLPGNPIGLLYFAHGGSARPARCCPITVDPVTAKDQGDKPLPPARTQKQKRTGALAAGRRAERRSEAYLAEAQRLSRTGSFGWRPDARELVWSEETFRIFQYDPARTVPTIERVLERVHPEDAALVKRTIERAREDGKPFDFEHRLLLPDASVKHVRVVAHAARNKSGGLEFVGAVMDISDRKRAEEELRRSESYLSEAQKLTHTGSWAWRVADREAVHLSEEWYRIYGFDPKEGLSVWQRRLQRMHPDDRADWRDATDRAIAQKSDYEVEHRILLPDGTIKHTHTIGHPVMNAAGEVVQFMGTMMDVTERKQAEEERERLRQANADLARVNRVTTLGELTASLAHEVNQPIAAVVANADACLRWLAGEPPDLEEARVAAIRIVRDGKRAAETISRVRQLFKKGGSQRELVDLNEIIREMIVLLLGETTRYSIAVETDLAADLPPVMADSVQLRQVLLNLIINGTDAMKEVDGRRELTIRSRRGENEQVVVSVSDTGVGLPAQRADQIFTAFFTTKPNGIGMGLSISRSIIDAHGGRLWATDNPPRGASFHFTLPVRAEP